MPGAEPQLERVAADQGHRLQLQLRLRQLALPLQAADGPVALAAAFGTGAGPAQHPGRVAGAMAVLPGDGQELGLAVEVDRGREGVDQGCYRTLMTGSCRKERIEAWAATRSAISRNALAPAESGRVTTTGAPRSASSRMPSSSGTAPRNGTPSFWAVFSPVPWLKMCASWPQFSQM